MTAISYKIKTAIEVSGIGRSRLYELMKAGKIAGRKEGRTTLVLADSLHAYVESLPSFAPEPQ